MGCSSSLIAAHTGPTSHGAIEVVRSAIISDGKVDQVPPDNWEIASAGNDAQLAGNLSVVLAILKVIHFAPLSRRQAGALAALSQRHSLMREAPIERRYLRLPRFSIQFGSFFTQIEIVKDQTKSLRAWVGQKPAGLHLACAWHAR